MRTRTLWVVTAIALAAGCGEAENHPDAACVDPNPAAAPSIIALGAQETRGGNIFRPQRLDVRLSEPIDSDGDVVAGVEFEITQGPVRMWHAVVLGEARRGVRFAEGALEGAAAASGQLEPWENHTARGRYLMATTAGCIAPGEWSEPKPFRTDDDSARLFSTTQILDIRIELSPQSYAAIDAEARPPGCVPYSRNYYPGTVKVGDQTFEGAGVRVKGGCGSARRLNEKAGFKIHLGWDDPNVAGCPAERRAYGREHLTLNNMVQDSSMSHELLAYELYRAMGVPVSRAAYTRVWLNDSFLGLYLNLENIDRRMLARNFASSGGMLYEGTYWCDLVAGNVRDNDGGCLTREFSPDACSSPPGAGDDPLDYAPLRTMIRALDDLPSGGFYPAVRNVFDMDAIFGLWAVEGYVSHWDGYIYEIRNNYRVYHDPNTGLWSIIPTGVDQTFDRTTFDVWGVAGRLAVSCLQESDCEADFARRLREVVDVAGSLGLEQKRQFWRDRALTILGGNFGREFSIGAFNGAHQNTATFLAGRSATVLSQLAARGH